MFKMESFPIFSDGNCIGLCGSLTPSAVFKSFQYVPCNVPGPGFDESEFESQYEGCDCLSLTCDSSCPCTSRFGASYNEEGKLLHPQQFDLAQKPVVECNSKCACGGACVNRLIQHRLKRRVLIFQHERKGFGLKTLDKIKSHQFVCEYAGEILTFNEAKNRTKLLTKHDKNYILAVKEHLGNGQVLETFVDPSKIGNIGRFINHSCQPNLFMVPVRVNNSIPHLSLFALRDIDVGEELSFDYSGKTQVQSEISDSGNRKESQGDSDQGGKSEPSSHRKLCFCDSVNCKGYMPYDDTLFD